MSDFEREVASCLNDFFEKHQIRGFAYRLKQSKFSTQYVDLLVDSLDPRYYCAIECKSIRGKKLYFSQHFHADKNGMHQIDAISDFLTKTGRRGYLAVEFRSGPGRALEAFLYPWDEVALAFGSRPGISLDEFRERGVALSRCSERYTLDQLYPKTFEKLSQTQREQ
ncbi:MAG: Holliday junction resolvase [Methanomicrobiales archaeon]|nr:Holliday junction resolvase [Methanomicrobiales archaeon]